MKRWEFWLSVTLLVGFIFSSLMTALAHVPGMQHTEWLSYIFNKAGSNCCNLGEAKQLDDADWRCVGSETNCEVKLLGVWAKVDPSRIADPKQNRTGFAYVWVRTDVNGKIIPWCFMPGAPQG